MMRIKLLLLALLVGFSSISIGQECMPKAPNPPRLVNDYANVLDDRVEAKLEKVLVGFNDTTSTQIAIVTVNDLCGYDVSSFAFSLGEKWGVGNAEFNNGVVILLKPKVGNSKGQVFIATGYGLEGVLPDAICARIVQNEMIPAFKQNDYETGILRATQVVIDITGGEYSADNYNGRKKKKTKIFPFFIILIIAFFMLIGVFSRARRYSRSNNLSFWAALWLMGSMSGRHRGYYNDFSSGGGGFGGFSGGGGFGGFGGGSFGGGGAGGSW